jgi:single-stranded DNA-binding protein
MNSIKMTGRLTREPDLKHIGTRKRAVCEMRLAVYNGRYAPTFINVSVFDGPAYVAAEHLTKGSRVKVEGELRFNERTKTGARRFEPHSIVGRVEQLGRPPERNSEAVEQTKSQSAGTSEPAPA